MDIYHLFSVVLTAKYHDLHSILQLRQVCKTLHRIYNINMVYRLYYSTIILSQLQTAHCLLNIVIMDKSIVSTYCKNKTHWLYYYLHDDGYTVERYPKGKSHISWIHLYNNINYTAIHYWTDKPFYKTNKKVYMKNIFHNVHQHDNVHTCFECKLNRIYTYKLYI